MKFLFLTVLLFSLIAILPAYAESQTLPTDKGALDVMISYEKITPGELTTLKTDFLNPKTGQVQEHIDWTFSVFQDGEEIWGPTQLSHTSAGSLKNLRFEFPENGLYTLEFGVEGILFIPMPRETVSFDVTVGDVVAEQTFVIPDWIKNNAGWWADGTISDSDFITGIQYLIQQEILVVPQSEVTGGSDEEIPEWIKNNAGWWAQVDNFFV